jgi:glycosyltransferase involved in cell wall biosynthesis
MTLLFVTQKLHEQDAFVKLWVRTFMRRGYKVKVLCLEDQVSPQDFEIFSMGKERGYSKLRQVFRFWRFITTQKYDRVFVHMAPVYGLLGGWYWILTRKPVYLWYTHYKKSFSAWITCLYAKRVFCATAQSVPWMKIGDNGKEKGERGKDISKKIVVGHGIDVAFWKKRDNTTHNPKELLMVHRLSRSKRVEISLRALRYLPEYSLVIYGIEAEPDYVTELKSLVDALELQSRVTFKGTTPMENLLEIYASHRLILNMASETIDKTMLEAMTCGCFPVTTKRNAESTGIMEAPENDTPESLAAFIKNFSGADADQLYSVVKEKHNLEELISKIDQYIAKGE